MAEAMVNAEQDTREKADSPECAVCLQPCVHPAQLPCGHIFCYLCVKGFANQNKRCAMCRQEIPRDFVEQPHLLQRPQPLEAIEGFDGGYQWFYEGRNGWWQYDERTSKELEISYKKGEKSIELLIAGFLYIVDFENMLQLRRNDPSRRRQIKRDFFSIPKKGIAGLRTDPLPPTSENSEGRPGSPTRGPADAVTPTTPSNTPQSPTSGRESPNQEQDFQATVERISNLRLDSNDGEASRSNESGRNSWINLPSNDDLENNPEISRGVGESLGIYDQEGDIEFERNNLGLMANSGIHSETERSNFATAGSSSESSGANSENLRARCNSENNEDEERESRGNLGILAGYWRDKYMGRHRRDD